MWILRSTTPTPLQERKYCPSRWQRPAIRTFRMFLVVRARLLKVMSFLGKKTGRHWGGQGKEEGIEASPFLFYTGQLRWTILPLELVRCWLKLLGLPYLALLPLFFFFSIGFDSKSLFLINILTLNSDLLTYGFPQNMTCNSTVVQFPD